MAGPNPISYLEIDAWVRLHRMSLDGWELDALRGLDDAYLRTLSEDVADG
jgi:hypothetical protein